MWCSVGVLAYLLHLMLVDIETSELPGKIMNEKAFQKRLNELLAEIRSMPQPQRTRLELLAEETKKRHKELKTTFISLQENLDYLRLSLKYLLFDLEATRRENGQLRKLLKGKQDNSGPGGPQST